jgi:asparagine synthase (glutamine-hydrolysing)
MLRRIAHRGPDDEDSIRLGESWLGHRRLSIVDVEGGRQPLSTADGELWLVGNGEIYNHQQVRAALGSREFATDSDNEVALHLVDERGPEAISELKGMFAFVAAGRDGRFVAARDPVGIKPLYWARRDGAVQFASELRAFDADWRPLAEVFPPGHYWTPGSGLVRFAEAAPQSPDELESPDEPDGALLRSIRERLVSSVERQMMGDVPVGVFLSGGLDSSLVAAIAAEYYRERGQRLQTFAVGLPDSPDLIAARRVAEYLDTDHHERIYTAGEALETLPEVVRAMESFDPTLVHSAVPNYMLAELAARHVKVVLTGEGADEIFAGYEYLREFDTQETLHAEIVRTIEGLHNLNLQRCDRVTMIHGLEARVPFLELDVIELGLSLPAGWKLATDDRPEKYLLRKAFDGWLPHDLLWRKKAQFGDGSGASSVLRERAAGSVSEEEFEALRDEVDPPLRTREEAAYYKILADHLEGLRPGGLIGRFATA